MATARALRFAPLALAAALAVAYVAVEPRTPDLAASVYRSRLFGAEGFTVWNGNWYSGHHTPAYSVIVPPLAWLLGPALLGALATVASAALFEPLARRHFGARAALWGGLWFAVGAAAQLWSGRITFAVGVALGLAALLAVQRDRPPLASVLAAACALASPVAALFLALVAVAHALADRRAAGAAVAVVAVGTPLLLEVAFPDGGEGPFSTSAFWPLPVLALAFAALAPARERALRAGALLYALLGAIVFAFDTPVGGSVVRLGALAGGPLLLAALIASRVRRAAPPAAALGLVLAGFAVWQVQPAIRDVAETWGDRSTEASFYRPLLGFLERTGGRPFRVEIPFTSAHWEAAEVAHRFPLARGWLRPDDIDYNAIFYDGPLNEATYRAWLGQRGVRFVAVPRAEDDYSARAELRLIARRPDYLRPVWRSRDWRVFEVTPAPALVTPPLAVTRLGRDDVALRAARAGSSVVRVRWTPYWRVEGGCVERAGDWTRVTARRAGTLRITIAFSLGRVFDRGRRCD